jgi:uracil-DNA glycosylase
MENRKSASAAPAAHQVDKLLKEIRACRICEAHLPLGPRPVVQASATSRLLIVSQAPGRKVHESGIPFDDVSGDRLRDWLGIDKAMFYDASRIAIVPMGFCFPGSGKGGDLPPRPECAPAWHPRLLPLLKQVKLTLVIGQYAQAGLLGVARTPGPRLPAVAASEPAQPAVAGAQSLVRSGVAGGAARAGGRSVACRWRLNGAAC